MSFIFLTGMARSGTTLLAKLIDGIDEFKIYPQPFPFFFRYAKEIFYQKINYPQTYYVLNNYFFEKKYQLKDLTQFLATVKIDQKQVRQILDDMRGFSGQYTDVPVTLTFPQNYSTGFPDLFKDLLLKMNDTKKMNGLGFKETQCEEFIPAFLANNWKTIQIIRNPFDVITSIQYGSGSEYTGQKRPTLFHLRNWRKSADLAILFAQNPGFLMIRFEDLVTDTRDVMDKIVKFLDPDLEIQNGQMETLLSGWKGNSSFENQNEFVNKNTINRYKKILPQEMINYINILFETELKYFGYEHTNTDKSELIEFKEPFKIESPDFQQDFSYSQFNLELEQSRLDLLKKSEENITEEYFFQAFIDKKVYRVLKEYAGN